MTRPADDDYPTPPEATRALLSVEHFAGGIWEPCAGGGAMAAVLRGAGYTVRATTIGESRHDPKVPKHRVLGGSDFLAAIEAAHPNIVTNPPYRIAEDIIRHALTFQPVKLAMLLNLKFLGSVGRARGLYREHPPARVWVIADRITMYPAGYDGPRGTATETHAWFVWDRSHLGAPAIGHLVAGDHREEVAA